MPDARKVRHVFNLLRAEVPLEEMSDREILRAAVSLVDMHPRPGPAHASRAIERGGRERRWAVDHVIQRAGWRIFSVPGTVVYGEFEASEGRCETDYSIARSIMESAA